MTRIRTLGPKWYAEASKCGLDPDHPVRLLLSRLFWIGPQDLDSCPEFRHEQLFNFGLSDRAELDRAIAFAEEKGWLVSPEDVVAQDGKTLPFRIEAMRARAQTTALARLAEAVGSDMAVMGREAFALDATLSDRLASVQRELEAIASDVRAIRKPFIDKHVQKLAEKFPLDPAATVKLHLGAGNTHLPGWINSSWFPSDLSMHLSWELPFPDNSISFAYAGHVVEHLYYGAETLSLLREVRRVLKPGGVFRVIVPNMGLFLRKYGENDREFFEHWRTNAQAGALYFRNYVTPMELIMSYLFVGRDPGDFFAHKMGFDFETFERIGKMAGYSSTVESDYLTSTHPELRVDEVSVASQLMYKNERYSLFVELTK